MAVTAKSGLIALFGLLVAFTLFTQDGGEIAPFDIAFWRCFNYELSPRKAKLFQQTLRTLLAAHLREVNEAR